MQYGFVGAALAIFFLLLLASRRIDWTRFGLPSTPAGARPE